jgi:hypothetical protein
MWQKLIFVFCLIVLSCTFTFSQKRSVTNADLETYKQKRLQDERYYRENYQRLGMPSPEELDRRREQSMKETQELSNRLRAERLQREQIEATQRALSQSVARYPQYYPYLPDNTIYSGAWFNPYFRNRGFVRGPGVRPQAGYFAGGQFWPAPVGTHIAPQPIIRIGGGGGHGGHGGGGGGGGGHHR